MISITMKTLWRKSLVKRGKKQCIYAPEMHQDVNDQGIYLMIIVEMLLKCS